MTVLQPPTRTPKASRSSAAGSSSTSNAVGPSKAGNPVDSAADSAAPATRRPRLLNLSSATGVAASEAASEEEGEAVSAVIGEGSEAGSAEAIGAALEGEGEEATDHQEAASADPADHHEAATMTEVLRPAAMAAVAIETAMAVLPPAAAASAVLLEVEASGAEADHLEAQESVSGAAAVVDLQAAEEGLVLQVKDGALEGPEEEGRRWVTAEGEVDGEERRRDLRASRGNTTATEALVEVGMETAVVEEVGMSRTQNDRGIEARPTGKAGKVLFLVLFARQRPRHPQEEQRYTLVCLLALVRNIKTIETKRRE